MLVMLCDRLSSQKMVIFQSLIRAIKLHIFSANFFAVDLIIISLHNKQNRFTQKDALKEKVRMNKQRVRIKERKKKNKEIERERDKRAKET
jgi:hypothetical protein